MKKTGLLKKLSPLGVATLGAISVIGITTSSAQAGQLSWENGATEFFSQVNNGGTRPTGDFDIIFSDQDVALISTATDEFAMPEGPFPPVPPNAPFAFTDPSLDAPATFLDMGAFGGSSIITLYELQDDLVFDFGNGVEVTYGAGSEFLGEFDFAPDGITIEGVEAELEIAAAGTQVEINGDVYGFDTDPDILTGITLTFDEPAQGIASEYSAGVTVSSNAVPEPTTILGLLTIGGLGLALKCKKQL